MEKSHNLTRHQESSIKCMEKLHSSVRHSKNSIKCMISQITQPEIWRVWQFKLSYLDFSPRYLSSPCTLLSGPNFPPRYLTSGCTLLSFLHVLPSYLTFRCTLPMFLNFLLSYVTSPCTLPNSLNVLPSYVISPCTLPNLLISYQVMWLLGAPYQPLGMSCWLCWSHQNFCFFFFLLAQISTSQKSVCVMSA